MSFLFNLGLFFVGFLPAGAFISMALAAVFGDSCISNKGWDIGWNPILALIVFVPWVIPTVVIVPLLHFLGVALAKRYSPLRTRCIVLGAAPTLFLLGILGLWGWDNFQLDFIVPIGAAGVLYGALQRIPGPQSGP